MATEYLLLDYLPDRSESCIQGAIEALNANNPLVEQVISSLEAPSAIAVVRELFPGLIIKFVDIPQPDPRVPIRPVSTLLWRYDGCVAVPGVDAPPDAVAASVASVARTRYNLSDWSGLAAMEAQRLGEPAVSAVAVMVHPSDWEPPDTLWDWRFKMQVAAALVATHLCEKVGSDPVELLSEIVDGPIDWTISAALIALLDVAQRRPERRFDMASLFMDVVRRPPNPIWAMNCGYIAAVACRRVPDLPEDVCARLDQIIDKFV